LILVNYKATHIVPRFPNFKRNLIYQPNPIDITYSYLHMSTCLT